MEKIKMNREGLPGFWDNAFVAVNTFDHELMNHYGLDTDSPKVQMVHKKLIEAQQNLEDIRWVIDEIHEELRKI